MNLGGARGTCDRPCVRTSPPTSAPPLHVSLKIATRPAKITARLRVLPKTTTWLHVLTQRVVMSLYMYGVRPWRGEGDVRSSMREVATAHARTDCVCTNIRPFIKMIGLFIMVNGPFMLNRSVHLYLVLVSFERFWNRKTVPSHSAQRALWIGPLILLVSIEYCSLTVQYSISWVDVTALTHAILIPLAI